MAKIRLKTLQIRGIRHTKAKAYNIKPKDSDNTIKEIALLSLGIFSKEFISNPHTVSIYQTDYNTNQDDL